MQKRQPRGRSTARYKPLAAADDPPHPHPSYSACGPARTDHVDSHWVFVRFRHSLCKDLLEYARATWHGAGLNGLGGLPLGGLLELEVGIVTVREYACAFPMCAVQCM